MPIILYRSLVLLSLLLLSAACTQPSWHSIENGQHVLRSPGNTLELRFGISDGVPHYSLHRGNEVVAGDSRLGSILKQKPDGHKWKQTGYRISEHHSNWEQPWGEKRIIEDHHNSIIISCESLDNNPIKMDIEFRLFDSGLGFRYIWPEQEHLSEFTVMDELTEVALPGDAETWWIPAYIPNRYEHVPRNTKLSEIDTVHTPFTLRITPRLYVSVHEAALTDYSSAAFFLNKNGNTEVELFPWMDGTGEKVRGKTPFQSPWRTIKVSEDAGGLITNYIDLNLNEPSKIEDTSWIKPGKYVGIWWDMHLDTKTWSSGERHGATTEYTKQWIDFAAEHGFNGVLVEGWNLGWDGNWVANSNQFDFTTPYPDYNLTEVLRYAQEKGSNIIMHNETSTGIENYERQMDEAFALYESLGINTIKSGYVGDMIANGQWHHGQYMVRHYRKVVEKAARHGIMLDVHEPIKDTGIRRTWPNMMTREGARGQEYNAWSVDGGNFPDYVPTILFTRMLSGPFDYTPGVFDLNLKYKHEQGSNNRVRHTLAKELALYIVIYSPLHMAADLMQSYEEHPEAFEFIKAVPTDWEDTVVLNAEIAEYAVIARKKRNSDDWYVGGVAGYNPHSVALPLHFLDDNATYTATFYRDGENAHWEKNPFDFVKEMQQITAKDIITLKMAAGGGVAVRISKN